MSVSPAYRIEPMTLADVNEVADLEQVCFSAPWPRSAFQSDLRNSYARYVVLRAEGSPTILGYAGLWLLVDEAHITTIAVRPGHRRQGLGELLLLYLFDLAAEFDIRTLTLEVRAGNRAAQDLYYKYGFHQEGLRRHYYTDTGEDALFMRSGHIAAPETQALLQQRWQALWGRLTRAK